MIYNITEQYRSDTQSADRSTVSLRYEVLDSKN